eukprot:403343421
MLPTFFGGQKKKQQQQQEPVLTDIQKKVQEYMQQKGITPEQLAKLNQDLNKNKPESNITTSQQPQKQPSEYSGQEKIQQKQGQQYQNEEDQYKNNEEDHNDNQMPESYTSTTANGDGLEFDTRLGNIFDDIENIKNAHNQQKDGPYSNNYGQFHSQDPGFTMSDVPFNLSPISVILEVTQHLENIKKDFIRAQEKEQEYAETLKSIKYGYYVEKSSETLALILSQYQKFAAENEELRSRLENLEHDKFKLDKEYNQLRIDKSLIQQNLIEMQNELTYLSNENQKLKQAIDYMRRQKEENSLMQNEENRKVILDTQSSKDKVQKLKIEIKSLKHKLSKIENYKELYNDIKQKDAERQTLDIQNKWEKELIRQIETKSLLGHLKAAKLSNNMTNQQTEKLSAFISFTYNFLTPQDVLNITGLNRKFSGTFMKHNSRIFIRLFNQRTHELTLKLNEVQQKCDVQEFIIKRNETRDQIRSMMASETGDEKIKHIIEKHVVKPHLQQMQQSSQNDVNISQTSGKVTQETERALKIVTSFMGQYLEQFKAFQQFQLKLQEEQLKQQQKELDKKNKLDNLDPKKGGYKLVKGAKKLVGAFSYFGGFKGSQKQEPQSQQDIEYLMNQQFEDHQKQMTEEEIKEQQLKNQQNDSRDISNQIDQNEDKSISTEPSISIQEDSQSDTEELQRVDLPQPAYANLETQEDTIKSLDQIQSPEEMNDFMHKIGGFLLNDKSRLTEWIRGVQQGFAQFYILAKQLYIESRELEILRDFLVLRVENMKLRIEDLLNQKEDMAAIHSSDSAVKEHLIQKINELDKLFMERSTELLFEKRKVQELAEEKKEFDQKFETSQVEINSFKTKVSKEVKTLERKQPD